MYIWENISKLLLEIFIFVQIEYPLYNWPIPLSKSMHLSAELHLEFTSEKDLETLDGKEKKKKSK